MCSEVMIEKATAKAMPCRNVSEKPDKRTFEQSRDRRFTNPAQGERSERDSELAGRQVSVEVLQQTPSAAWPSDCPGGERLDTRRAHADERKLRGDKKAVSCDQ